MRQKTFSKNQKLSRMFKKIKNSISYLNQMPQKQSHRLLNNQNANQKLAFLSQYFKSEIVHLYTGKRIAFLYSSNLKCDQSFPCLMQLLEEEMELDKEHMRRNWRYSAFNYILSSYLLQAVMTPSRVISGRWKRSL